MISRGGSTNANPERVDVWAKIAAPLPEGCIAWRQDGRAIARDGKFFARFVAYIEANTVRERLDTTVPGEWDLTLELLPTLVVEDGEDATCSFKARLQILGVIREDVGAGKDYKQAATDAFKRAAVRFGIAHELYAYEQNWVQVDSDGKYAKPLEDPGEAYARRMGGEVRDIPRAAPRPDAPTALPNAKTATGDVGEPSCPKCGGRMWDNRLTKKNPKQPDYRCRQRSCDGVIWPLRNGDTPKRATVPADEPPLDESQAVDDGLPF